MAESALYPVPSRAVGIPIVGPLLDATGELSNGRVFEGNDLDFCKHDGLIHGSSMLASRVTRVYRDTFLHHLDREEVPVLRSEEAEYRSNHSSAWVPRRVVQTGYRSAVAVGGVCMLFAGPPGWLGNIAFSIWGGVQAENISSELSEVFSEDFVRLIASVNQQREDRLKLKLVKVRERIQTVERSRSIFMDRAATQAFVNRWKSTWLVGRVVAFAHNLNGPDYSIDRSEYWKEQVLRRDAELEALREVERFWADIRLGPIYDVGASWKKGDWGDMRHSWPIYGEGASLQKGDWSDMRRSRSI